MKFRKGDKVELINKDIIDGGYIEKGEVGVVVVPGFSVSDVKINNEVHSIYTKNLKLIRRNRKWLKYQ